MRLEEKRKINRILRRIDVPANANKMAYGKSVLNNIINQQIEEEMNKDYDDFFQLTKPKPISEEWNLGGR